MEIGFNNVSYNYRLRNINYVFESGKITCVIGKSGSGKSLIGHIIMGIDSPTNGYITIDGKRNFNLRSLRKDIGYVFQNPFDHIFCNTVYEEISYGLRQYKFKVDKQDEQVSKALKMVGLDDSYLKLDPRNLSSGEIERVAIASSLVLNPKTLILDEPTVYLDNNGVRDLNKLLKMLRDKYKKTIIVISNDISCVSEIYDNYLLLSDGKVANNGGDGDIVLYSDVFSKYGMEVADIFNFIRMCNDKGIPIKYTNNIDSLILDVIDNV